MIAKYLKSRYLMRIAGVYENELCCQLMRSDSDPTRGEDRTFKSVWYTQAGKESWKTVRPGRDQPYTVPVPYGHVYMAFKTLPSGRIPPAIYAAWKQKYAEEPMCAALVPMIQHAMMLYVDAEPRRTARALNLSRKGGTPVLTGGGPL